MMDATDKFSAVFGNDQDNLMINTPDGIYHSAYNSSWSASGINPAFAALFPEMNEDSYATVGLTGPAAFSSVSMSADPLIVDDITLSPTISSYFTTNGATSLNVNTITGGSWFVLNTAGNALPDTNLRVLIMQITTTGTINGVINYQIFPLGVGANQVIKSIYFNGVGVFGSGNVFMVTGCTDSTAYNYDSTATVDDGSCTYTATCTEDAPTNLFASDIVHNRATINWDNMNDANCMVDQYRIKYRVSWNKCFGSENYGSVQWILYYGLVIIQIN